MKISEAQLRAWVKRLIEINKGMKNAPAEQKPVGVAQMIGYIESLENVEI